jgi:hypothetical protein
MGLISLAVVGKEDTTERWRIRNPQHHIIEDTLFIFLAYNASYGWMMHYRHIQPAKYPMRTWLYSFAVVF